MELPVQMELMGVMAH